MDVHGLVAHLANYDLVLLAGLATILATLAVRAVPVEALHKLSHQRRLMTPSMQYLPAFLALDGVVAFGHLSDSLVALSTKTDCRGISRRSFGLLGLAGRLCAAR